MPSEADEVGSRCAPGPGPSSRLVNLRVVREYRPIPPCERSFEISVRLFKTFKNKYHNCVNIAHRDLDGCIIIRKGQQLKLQFYKTVIFVEIRHTSDQFVRGS